MYRPGLGNHHQSFWMFWGDMSKAQRGWLDMNRLVYLFKVAGHTVTIDAGAVCFDLPSWRKTYHRVVDPFIGPLRKRRSGEVRAEEEVGGIYALPRP